MTVLIPNELFEDRISAIKDYHSKTGVDRAQLDVSGGIDSAVMAGLLVFALGPDRVTLSHTKIHTNPEQTKQAMDLAESLGCPMAVGDFTAAYKLILEEMKRSLEEAGYNRDTIESSIKSDPTIEGSIRSTLRAPFGRGYNRLTKGGIRHGTGNECEDRFLRFYQKGGDGEVDTNPIAMLSKVEVFQLAFYLQNKTNASSGFSPIIAAVPTPDLWNEGDAHNDEDELLKFTNAPFTYGRIHQDTGKVTRFGTIEMVSRFMDNNHLGSGLFENELTDSDLHKIVEEAVAKSEEFFPAIEKLDVAKLIKRARWAERVTRHKLNPAIPTLGNRTDLIAKGILSKKLTE